MAEDRQSPLWTVHGGLVLVQVFFGVHYLAAKVLLEEIPPALWALIRVGAAALLMLALTRALGRPFPTSPSVLARLALYSLFGVVLNQLCYVEGLSRTTPMHASIIMITIPVGTIFFAVLLGREKLRLRKLFSLTVAFVGVLLIIRPTRAGLAGASVFGDLLILTNALSYSLFLVLSKRLLGKVDSLAATAVLLSFGALGMLVPGIPAALSFDVADVSTRTWGLGLWIVLFPTAAAYYINYWALARVDSSVVAFFIYLQPLIATSLSMVFFGERPTLMIAAGAALVFLAVYVALRPGNRSAKEPRAA